MEYGILYIKNEKGLRPQKKKQLNIVSVPFDHTEPFFHMSSFGTCTVFVAHLPVPFNHIVSFCQAYCFVRRTVFRFVTLVTVMSHTPFRHANRIVILTILSHIPFSSIPFKQ